MGTIGRFCSFVSLVKLFYYMWSGKAKLPTPYWHFSRYHYSCYSFCVLPPLRSRLLVLWLIALIHPISIDVGYLYYSVSLDQSPVYGHHNFIISTFNCINLEVFLKKSSFSCYLAKYTEMRLLVYALHIFKTFWKTDLYVIYIYIYIKICKLIICAKVTILGVIIS